MTKKNSLTVALVLSAIGLLPLSASAHPKAPDDSYRSPRTSSHHVHHVHQVHQVQYDDRDLYRYSHGQRTHSCETAQSHDYTFDAYRSIRWGIRKGDLTRQEARKLKREADRLERLKSQAWSDGLMTRKEAKRIRKAEKRLEKKIRREMRDNQYRR
jgi:hypothetical protein